MFTWHNRAAYYAAQQAQIDAIPAPSGSPSARIERTMKTRRWYGLGKRPNNSKPRRKDHRAGYAC